MTLLSFKKKDVVAEAQKAIEDKAKLSVDETLKKARKCLNSELFKEYEKEYAGAEKSVIEEMFIADTREKDPLRYGFKMKELIGKLRHLKALMNSVKLKAKVVK